MQIYVSISSINTTVRHHGLSLPQVPEFLKRHGFAGVELSDRHLTNCDAASIEQFRQSCAEMNCGLILDVNCDLTHPDGDLWQQEVSDVRRMLGIANELGARATRICLGGQSFSVQKLLKRGRPADRGQGRMTAQRLGLGKIARSVLLHRWVLRAAHTIRRNMPSTVPRLEEKIARATMALKEIMPDAARYHLPVAIENHWGISTRPENIIRVIEAVNSPWLGTCPDFGNFPRDVDPYKGLEILAPQALHVQAKSAHFRQDGEETSINYQRALRIIRDSGYDGTIAIEYEGGGRDLEGCIHTRDLITKHW